MPPTPTLRAALAAAVLTLAGAAAAAPGPGEVHAPAADFSLQDLDGVTHTLSAHRGEVVLLFIVGYG